MRHVTTSRCAEDEEFVQKLKHTLFINAAWSLSKGAPENGNVDESPWIQSPWLVNSELPRECGRGMHLRQFKWPARVLG